MGRAGYKVTLDVYSSNVASVTLASGDRSKSSSLAECLQVVRSLYHYPFDQYRATIQ